MEILIGIFYKYLKNFGFKKKNIIYFNYYYKIKKKNFYLFFYLLNMSINISISLVSFFFFSSHFLFLNFYSNEVVYGYSIA